MNGEHAYKYKQANIRSAFITEHTLKAPVLNENI
jgi:hypothetical protein